MRATLNYSSLINELKKMPGELSSSILKVDNAANYIIYDIFILAFGVITSFDRFHIKEAAKYEHFLIGFHRIISAGNYSSTKFDDEVKMSLSRDAFFVDSKIANSKHALVESPIQGHPTSDIGSAMLSKLLHLN